MRGRRNVHLALMVFTWVVLLGGALWLLSVAVDVARAGPGALFVAQAGGGTACSQAQPCGLQTALGRAVDGDEVYVAAGTYTGAGTAVISVTRSISLYGGWNGAASGPVARDPAAFRSILDGEGQRRVVFITDTLTAVIDGFTVQRGDATNSPPSGRGGGIYVYGAAALIANNVITGNTGSTGGALGGGICAEGAARGVTIRDNQILFNTASATRQGLIWSNGPGAGIFVRYSPFTRIANNIVLHNTGTITGSSWGGGICLWYSPDASITANQVEWNVGSLHFAEPSSATGGGIEAEVCDRLLVADNSVRHNTAFLGAQGRATGGGMFIGWSTGITISGNVIQDNVAAQDAAAEYGHGGGIYMYKCAALLEGNRVVHNMASGSNWGNGGGLLVRVQVDFTMVNNIVAENHASSQGGGMTFEAYGADTAITGTLLHNTFAGNNLGNSDGRNAIDVLPRWVTLVLTNNIICNHAYGIYASAGSVRLHSTLLFGNSSGDTSGPGILANTAAVTGQDPLLDATHHLRAGSPAIDRGVDAGVRSDIDGDPRPMAAGHDIGADEFAPKRVFLPLARR